MNRAISRLEEAVMDLDGTREALTLRMIEADEEKKNLREKLKQTERVMAEISEALVVLRNHQVQP